MEMITIIRLKAFSYRMPPTTTEIRMCQIWSLLSRENKNYTCFENEVLKDIFDAIKRTNQFRNFVVYWLKLSWCC